MRKAVIFDIQRGSTVDGPGIRTTVFFKGCNLGCKWCHNPESRSAEPQIMFFVDRCRGCGRCEGITAADADFVCFYGAKKICGREYSADELFDILAKDKLFYENSGGGVTFSGGECMLRADFLSEILKKCKEAGIGTAIDTAGYVPWEAFEKVMPYADIFLYDIKSPDNEIHRKYTGVPNGLILSNLSSLLERGAKVLIRIPVITGVNDSIEDMKKVRELLAGYRTLGVELMPYHKMGEHKYAALGLPLTKFEVPTEEKISELKRVFEDMN